MFVGRREGEFVELAFRAIEVGDRVVAEGINRRGNLLEVVKTLRKAKEEPKEDGPRHEERIPELTRKLADQTMENDALRAKVDALSMDIKMLRTIVAKLQNENAVLTRKLAER